MTSPAPSASHLALRFLRAALLGLPPGSIPFVAAATGALWHVVDGRRRRRLAANLRVALESCGAPDASRRTARRVFANMARVGIEVVWAERLLATPRQVRRRLTLCGAWPAPGDRAPRGGVAFLGHLGNWEIAARALRHHHGPVRAVVRRSANAALDAYLTSTRGGPGAVVHKGGAWPHLVSSLDEGAWVLVAGDQNAGLRGAFVPFFGLPARSHTTPARLALTRGVPLDLVTALRRPGGDLRFLLVRERIAHPLPGTPTPEAVVALTARVHRRLEHWVRRAPEQYNFLHRRWKDRPADEADAARVPVYDHRRREPLPAPSASAGSAPHETAAPPPRRDRKAAERPATRPRSGRRGSGATTARR